jgi:hypothetical protein
MFVQPSGPRHTAEDDGTTLTFTIPSKRNVFLLAFLGFWLCGWAFGEIMAPLGMFTAAKKDPGASLFMLVWLCGWTIGGGFAIYIWLWMLRGREIVSISPTTLAVKRDIFGAGRTKNYDITKASRLRFAPATYNPFDWHRSFAFWGLGGGVIAFDYGYSTIRFGAGLDDAEAEHILQRIRARFPQVATTNET